MSAGPFEDEPPALSREHIKKELELLHQRQHRTYRSALFGRLTDPIGDGATIEVTLRGEPVRFRVVDTAGELDLRRKLGDEVEEASVYVVPFARRLPRDLEAGFASGRVWWPRVEWMLPRRFGAKSGTPRLLGSRLRVVAQREGTRTYRHGEAPSVDLDEAWLVFLRDRLDHEGLETEAQFFAAALLDRERRGQALSRLFAEVKGAQKELSEVLERRMGASAPRVLAAWLGDVAVELAAMALVGEAARDALSHRLSPGYALLTTVVEQRVLRTPGHALRSARDTEGAAGLARALVDLGYLIPLVWQKLTGAADEPLRRAILGEAEQILAGEHLRPLALGSNRLPFAFEHRCKAFAEAIEAAAGAGDAAAARNAAERVDRAAQDLLAHESAQREEGLLEQVDMASRLSAFLAEPEAREALSQAGSAAPPHAEVIRLATLQAEVGGWVDWARQVARGDAAGPLGRSVLRLVGRVDQARDALDARFARAYERLVGQPGGRGLLRGAAMVGERRAEVLRIEDALERMGLELLAKSPELRLLILCMDGMSGANLSELWGSVARSSFVPVSRGPRLPVLAQVPTVTKLSRSALFAGRAVAPGESLDTARDEERLTQHPGVRALGEAPAVLLKGAVLGPGGGLSDDAARMVRGERRVVAVVVNAIDDQLKGSAQLRVTLSTEHIRPLRALLAAAESTGRLVLLVSDHGNISSQRFVGTAARAVDAGPEGADRGARHRWLRAGEAAANDEIALPPGALPAPKGMDRVAVAVHEALRYTSALHAGEHGGASLAEVLAPAVLLAPRGLLPELEALGVRESPVEPPAFWDREQARAALELAYEATPTAPPAASAEAAPRKAAQVALPFFDPITQPIAQPAAPAAKAQEPPPELCEALFRSELFRTQLRAIPEADRGPVKQAIELLVRHGGRVGRDRFAEALGISAGAKGARVPGFVDRMERVLNVDQEPVIGMDPRGLSVVLDQHRLRNIFLEDDGG